MINDKITPSVDYNQRMKRLKTQISEPPDLNSIKVPKGQNC